MRKIKFISLCVGYLLLFLTITFGIGETYCKDIPNDTTANTSIDNNNNTHKTKENDKNIQTTKPTDKSKVKSESNPTTENTITETLNKTPEPMPQKPLYTDINQAITDFNNNTTKNANATEKDAVVEININNGTIKLLNNTSIYSELSLYRTCKFDLNGKTITMLENATLNVMENSTVTILDSIGGGIIEKTKTTKNTNQVIVNSGNLLIQNGTYKINVENSSFEIIENIVGTLTIDGGNFVATSKSNGGYGIKVEDGTKLVVNNATIDVQNQDGSLCAIQSYPPIKNKSMNINIKNTKIKATSKTGCVKGVRIKRGEKCTIENCNVYVYTGDYPINMDNAATALELDYLKNVTVNGGKFIAVNDEVGSNLSSLGLYEGSNENITINDAHFYGNTSTIYSSITLNNCVFSGIHSGLQINSKTSVVNINGGVYESPWHGGIYVSNKETHIKNATLGAPKWSQSYYGKAVDWQPQYEEGVKWEGTLYSCIYIGGPHCDVTTYIDNCKLAYVENITKDFTITLTSNYNHKNSYLYINNTDAVKQIRVDSPNDNGYQGHLYVGENVNHTGIFGNGLVESIKTETKN